LSKDSSFAYAIGRIRAIEKRLLDKGKFDRMIESKTPEEAIKVVAEAGYAESSSFSGNIVDYEIVLKEEERKLFSLLKEISSQSEVFDIFMLKNDYHNIKVILKSEFLEIEVDDSLLNTGIIPVSQLRVIITDRDFDKLSQFLKDSSEHMKNSIEEVIDTFSRTKDPRQIDLILDRYYFNHILELSEKNGFSYVEDLVKIIIDTTNIKTYLRVRNLNMTLELLEKSLIPGGTISNTVFLENYEKSPETLLQATKHTKYYNLFSECINSYILKGSFARLEKLLDDYVINFVKKSKFKTLGIEPLIGYLVGKENEIKNLRIVMVGKINNISNNIIRERLRETYV
jgi:V/A-type H+-transporting ATPase subunit C